MLGQEEEPWYMKDFYGIPVGAAAVLGFVAVMLMLKRRARRNRNGKRKA